MTVVQFDYAMDKSKQSVICDTNVWYSLAKGEFEKPEDIFLTPTSFSLAELATSEVMAHDVNLYQNTIKMVYEKGGAILPSNPFDFILSNHDSKYSVDEISIKGILEDFSKLMVLDIPEGSVLDEELKGNILESSQQSRKYSEEFADFGTEKLGVIRKNINVGEGKKAHLGIDSTEINREMIKSVLNDYVKDMDYTIDFVGFDWSRIELFMTVTDNFFKKLETTRDMKVHRNDAIDWMNMLYVTPDDKYLTFEKSWMSYIKEDERICDYLYEVK